MSSNRPELVALRECLEAHEDHVDLLYLTDIEATLQAIHKWIGYGAKLNLSKSPDEEADIRDELGRRKAYKETIWDDLSGRTVYQ